MLFAELHGKLSPDASDLERREDTLTSTVFGTLIVGEAWRLLNAWLSRSRDVDGTSIALPDESGPYRYWFWPRLAEAEPDLLLLIGDCLVIVEAKYLSGKSSRDRDLDSDEAEDTDGEDYDGEVLEKPQDSIDQLAREWRSCDPEHPGVAHYPAELREAIGHGGANRQLIYLVRRPNGTKTKRELDASQVAIGAVARLFALGWSDLLAVLLAAKDAGDAPVWLGPLTQLLQRRGLMAFRGFGSVLDAGRGWAPLATWTMNLATGDRMLSFPEALAACPVDLVTRWAVGSADASPAPTRWRAIAPSHALVALQRLAGSLGRTYRWPTILTPGDVQAVQALARPRQRVRWRTVMDPSRLGVIEQLAACDEEEEGQRG